MKRGWRFPWRFAWSGGGWGSAWGTGQATIPVEDLREVRIKVNGPLGVRGLESTALRVLVTGVRRVQAADGVARVQGAGPTLVGVPAAVQVVVERVNGPVTLRDLQAPVRLERVRGPLNGRGLQEVVLGDVAGPALLQDVRGAVRGAGPRGPLTLRKVDGPVHLEQPVRGPAILRALRGDVHLAARGGLTLAYLPQPGQTVRLRTDRDARIALPPEADVRLVLRARGGFQVPFAAAASQGDVLEHTLGEGRSTLEVEAGGALTLALEAHLDEAAAPEEDLPGGSDWSDGLLAMLSSESDGEAPIAPRWRSDSSRAIHEERLTVLRMLAEGKLNAEQAERLLRALEGET